METITLPPELAALVAGATWEQVTVGESGARVYRLRGGAETRYLKVEPRRPHGAPHAEAARLRWLQGRLPVPALRYAGADERQGYMLTAEVPGADASDERLDEPFSGDGDAIIHRALSAGADRIATRQEVGRRRWQPKNSP